MTTATSDYSILIVEDDLDIVIGIQDLLEHDGYHVSIAGTCAEAIARARDQRYNAVLLDLGLPDGDGSSVLRILQEMDPTLPVIILTAYTSTERTVGSLAQGAFHYLTKPYNRDELRATLRRAVSMKALAAKAEHVEHALAESEERFRSIFESATDAIVLADESGCVLSWNKAASQLFGYRDEEMLGQALTRLMPPRYRAAHERGLARMKAGAPTRLIGRPIELEGLRRDGTEFPLELSLATWRSAAGSFYSGIIRDISERKQMEDALRRSEELLRNLINNTTAVIYVKEPDGRYVMTNTRFEHLFALSQDQIRGKTDHELFPKDIADGFREHDLAVLNAGVPLESEEYAPHPDGLHTYLSIKFPLLDAAGRPYLICGISTDITERKQAEEQLLRRDKELADFIEHATIGLHWVDAEGRVVWANQAELDLLGYSKPEYIGHSIAEFHADPAVAGELLRRLTAFDNVRDYEARLRCKDGSLKYVLIDSNVYSEDGRFIHTRCFTRDITERKRMETALRASEERFELAVRGSTDGLWDGRPLDGAPWHSPHTPVWWSPRVREMLGVTEQEFPDMLESWTSRLHPDDKPRVFEALTAHIDRREPYDVEYRLLTKRQGYRWFRGRGQALWSDDGRVLRMAGSLQCITDRKLAEEALRASEERLRLALAGADQGIWDWHLSSGGLYLSDGVEILLGLPPGTFPGTQAALVDLIYMEDRSAVLNAVQGATRLGSQVTFEHRVVWPDGTLHWLAWSGRVCKTSDGDGTRILGTVWDNTERRRR